MKFNKGNLFVLFSTIALLILLAIQVYWILEAAKIKEALFNEKANMVLSQTIDALGSDKETCRSIEACIVSDSTQEVTSKLAKGDINKIDSLLHHFMQKYHIQIKYKFNIGKQQSLPEFEHKGFANATYMMPLNDISKMKGVEIKLIFPEKRQFVLAEMGMPFFVSIVLIVTMIIIFWKTNSSLIKEKKIAAHTNDFINNMSHEFKTPLSNISLAAKMIVKQNQSNNEAKIQHYTSIILDENEKLNQQIELVLNLNALERDEVLIQKNLCNFHHLIEMAVKNMCMQIEHHNAELGLSFKAENFNVNGDKFQLLAIICNLIDNALKYANDKAVIKIETWNKNQKLMINVSDNGKGIPKEYQHKVFEKYFRVPDNDIHTVKGFGLGLAYIKKIVEMHQGDIHLNSQMGKGTTFTITLPYV